MPQDTAVQIAATARELAKHIQQQPVQLEGLRMVVKRFIEEGAKANIARWDQAVELTARRAGLIVCGDLETRQEGLGGPNLSCRGDLSAVDKMKELFLVPQSDSTCGPAPARHPVADELEVVGGAAWWR